MPLDLFSNFVKKQEQKHANKKQKNEVDSTVVHDDSLDIRNILHRKYEEQMNLLHEKIRLNTFSGVVEIGNRKMNRIGFPTANIQCNISNIKNGFYLSQIILNNEQYHGLAFIKKENKLAEIYIFDFNRNIYGMKITVKILYFISILYELNKISLHEQFKTNIQLAKKNL